MCCFFDTATRKHHYLNASADLDYLTSVFNSYKIDLVVMEACGQSSGDRSEPRVSSSPFRRAASSIRSSNRFQGSEF